MAERQLFGEFLIQKNLIKADAILALLVEQVRSQPSICEVVFENKLLSDSQQFEVFRTQSLNGWDYQQSCVALGYWNENLAKQILAMTAKSRMPIGQLIVAKGLLSFGDLTKALDEFVGICESEGIAITQPCVTPPEVSKIQLNTTAKTSVETANLQEKSTDSVDLVSSSEVLKYEVAAEDNSVSFNGLKINKIDGEILSEFFEVMPKMRDEELKMIFNSWNVKFAAAGVELILTEMRAIRFEFESLLAAAKFVRAEGISYVAQRILELISKFTNHPLDQQICGKVVEELCAGVNICWNMRKGLESNRSEGFVLKSTEAVAELKKFDDNCKLLLA